MLVIALVVLVGGNVFILGASFLMQRWAPPDPMSNIEAVSNLAAVDGQVWRGAAPGDAGYKALRANGVATVVDLRAEEGVPANGDELEALGLDVVHLPIRDGQTPTPEQVETFLDVVENSRGTVFLHCGAGVGRTGAMAAAYLVATGQVSGAGALARNLAVGPPSLEQMAFAVSSDRPPVSVVAVSRFLDAPRRLWHNLT